MNRSKAICSVLLLVPAFALVSPAHAEYKCDAPPQRIDRVACEKAKESPEALRRYIERMRPIESLQFSDYVNEAQARAWAQNESKPAPTNKAVVETAKLLPEHSGA